MQIHNREIHRLKQVRPVVNSRFARLGANKRQEITRLLYEISKRDRVPPQKLLNDFPSGRFSDVKRHLLKMRFPHTARRGTARVHLPKIEINPARRARLLEAVPPPKRVYVESAARSSYLARVFRVAFPESDFIQIQSAKKRFKALRKDGSGDYNTRLDTYFVVHEQHDYFKKCPCTRKAIPCGYHIFNLSFGCLYECTYCYLQEYANSPGIIFTANIESFFDLFVSYRNSSQARRWQRGSSMRIGTGEFSDSLMLDDVTGYSIPLIDFFRTQRDVIFEFKTKSNNIKNLLETAHGGNIVVAWSLNPQRLIDGNEFYTAPLCERIGSAKKCEEAGYRVAFHFDPVFFYEGWEHEYREVVDLLFGEIKPRKIAWISIGTLRFKPGLKQIIENRFPDNRILDSELILGYDRKLRYPYGIRLAAYSSMIKMLRRHSKKLPLYLCMESRSMWEDVKLEFPFR
jgi:spore photoproduct lyase